MPCPAVPLDVIPLLHPDVVFGACAQDRKRHHGMGLSPTSLSLGTSSPLSRTGPGAPLRVPFLPQDRQGGRCALKQLTAVSSCQQHARARLPPGSIRHLRMSLNKVQSAFGFVLPSHSPPRLLFLSPELLPSASIPTTGDDRPLAKGTLLSVINAAGGFLSTRKQQAITEIQPHFSQLDPSAQMQLPCCRRQQTAAFPAQAGTRGVRMGTSPSTPLPPVLHGQDHLQSTGCCLTLRTLHTPPQFPSSWVKTKSYHEDRGEDGVCWDQTGEEVQRH